MLKLLFACFVTVISAEEACVVVDAASASKDCECPDENICPAEGEVTSGCVWLNLWGVQKCRILCNTSINNNGGKGNKLTVYVDNKGNDQNIGTEDKPLKTIEQVKRCYQHNTTMKLSDGTYSLTRPGNMSRVSGEEDYYPYFAVVGESKAKTIIFVEEDDFDKLHIDGAYSEREVLYVYRAIFNFTRITVEVRSIPNTDSSLFWMHETSVMNFEDVLFNGGVFPKHLFIHTGGDLNLTNVVIDPPNILNGNIIYWYGSSHKGSWLLDNVQIVGRENKNMVYQYENSLFEVDSADVTLTVNFRGCKFENITWIPLTVTSKGAKRQSNAVVPKGLLYTAKDTNKGPVTISNSDLTNLDVRAVPGSAPVAVVSLPAIPEPFVIDSSRFRNNLGPPDGGGAVASGANVAVKVKGKSVFDGNKAGDFINDFLGGSYDVDPEVIGGVGGPGTIVTRQAGDDNGLPKWALGVIIAVGVVVVIAVVIVIVAAVYFTKRKYTPLNDDEDFNDSSSSSMRSSEKEGEMESV